LRFSFSPLLPLSLPPSLPLASVGQHHCFSLLTMLPDNGHSDDSKPRRGLNVAGFVAKYKANMIIYTCLSVLLLWAWHFVSDGDFSFLMTLGSFFLAFAFVVLIFKVYTQKSAAGVSLKTLVLYAIVFFFRLCSILIYEGYLPFDKSGDWLYQVVEVSSLLLVGAAIYLTSVKLGATYSGKHDKFANGLYLPDKLAVLWVVIPALLLALVLHPKLNSNFITDVCWTFSVYLEAVAVLPQLFMFQTQGGEVEAFTSHFVFCIGAARMMHLAFWFSSFHELNDRMSGSAAAKYPGHVIVFAQIVHLVLMLDFFYYYVKSLRTGGPMMLPVSARQEV